MSFDDNYKNYILSKSKDNIELITYAMGDNNTDCLNTAIVTIQEYIQLSILDIDIRLIDLHSKEIERAYKTTDTIYPLYGAVVPYNSNLLNCFWKEYSFLESNPFSYSITRVAQNIII
jgi:hypothetical protein